ncbi:hypothetical protein Tco_0131529 [Tanacetum coccineum]
MNDLANLITLNSIPTTKELNIMTNDKVIAPGMFRINLFKTSREHKVVPFNKVRASVRRNPIIVSQPLVITKKVEVEEHHRNLLLSKNKKHMSSECNNIKLAIRNDKSEVVCDMFEGPEPKKVGSKESLASPKPRKPGTCLRWSPTGRMFDLNGKIIVFTESECQSDSSKGSSNLFMVRRLRMLKAYD